MMFLCGSSADFLSRICESADMNTDRSRRSEQLLLVIAASGFRERKHKDSDGNDCRARQLPRCYFLTEEHCAPQHSPDDCRRLVCRCHRKPDGFEHLLPCYGVYGENEDESRVQGAVSERKEFLPRRNFSEHGVEAVQQEDAMHQ